MESRGTLIDCSERSSIPHCALLRGVSNQSSEPIAIQGYIPAANGWYDVLPFVAPHQHFEMQLGGIFLPRDMILRSVSAAPPHHELKVFGVLGDGMMIEQPAL